MTTVVGSGTGANYACVAGALCALEEEGLRPSFLISTSGSGLPFAFRANGGSMRDFLAVARETPPLKIIRPNWAWPLVPGLFHIDRVGREMGRHVANTFKDNEIPHTVIAFDSDAKEEKHFGPDTPDVLVTKGVQASMSIPWAMRHVEVDGRRYTDGGIVHNFAIDLPPDPAVGIRVLGKPTEGAPWRWWGTYSWNHVDGMLMALEREHVEDGLWANHKIVTIRSPISGMDFHKVDGPMIDGLFAIGYEAVKRKMASGWGWRP